MPDFENPCFRETMNNKEKQREPSDLMQLLARIEACLPENPYPESVFPMTEEEYVKVIPDPRTRTAISGFMGRFVFEVTKRRFIEALKDEFEC